LYRDFELRLGEGDVVYIMGDSGSGKSVLLRALGEDLGPSVLVRKGWGERIEVDYREDAVRGVLAGVSSMYFKRLSRVGRAYVRKAEFVGWLEVQSVENLGRCLGILHTLGQCKAYLYWSCEW